MPNDTPIDDTLGIEIDGRAFRARKGQMVIEVADANFTRAGRSQPRCFASRSAAMADSPASRWQASSAEGSA